MKSFENFIDYLEINNLNQTPVRVEFVGTTSSSLKSIIKESNDINTRLRLLDALKILNNNNYIDEIKWNLQSLYCFLSFTEIFFISSDLILYFVKIFSIESLFSIK